MAGSRSDKMLHRALANKWPAFNLLQKLRVKHLVPPEPNHEMVGPPFALPVELGQNVGSMSAVRFLTGAARGMKQSSGDQPAGFFAARMASFRHAFRGVAFAIRSETHVRIDLVVTVAVVGAGLYFDLTTSEWCSIALAIGLVIASEILNTAIERLVDIVSPEHNAAAGRVKDIAAGATLVAAGCSVVVGVLVFGPRLVVLLSH